MNQDRILFISLYPMCKLGGGETYIINAARAAALAGAEVTLCSPMAQRPARSGSASRLAAQFIISVQRSIALLTPQVVDWGAIVSSLGDYDYVWLNQYLSNDCSLDVVANVLSNQKLLLTNLGHEPIRDHFNAFYHSVSYHYFVEISPFAISRLSCRREHCAYVGAGVWEESFVAPGGEFPGSASKFTNIALGRVLAHKGIEHTIRAMCSDDKLIVVGPLGDDAYGSFLRREAEGKDVDFFGEATAEELDMVFRRADVLIASSTCSLYDGRRLEQAELLGLVLLEGSAKGRLVVASSIPSFTTVMNDIGLSDFIYREGDPSSLREVLKDIKSRSAEEVLRAKRTAQTAIREKYLWNNYWGRVKQFISTGVP